MSLLLGRRLGWAAVRDPFSEQVNARLRPGTFSLGWWRRHHRAADSSNAVIDRGRVRFHLVVTGKVETFDHPADHAFVCVFLLCGFSPDDRRGIRFPTLPSVPETTALSRSLRYLPESDQTAQNKTPGRSRLHVRGSSLPARRCQYPTSRSSVVERVVGSL